MNSVTKRKIKKFLHDIGATQVVYNSDSSKKNSPMTLARDIESAIIANSNDSDVYFYINGGPKETDVRQYTTLHIDLDAGRDDNGKYLNTRSVLRLKKKMIAKINEFVLKPSYIVETRNGYQVYWILNKPTTDKREWKAIEARIATFFIDVGADKRTIKPNQLYRLPYTYWRKRTEKCAPFWCTIIACTGARHTLQSFIDALSRTDSIHMIDTDRVSKTVSYTKPWAAPAPCAISTTKTTESTIIPEVVDFLEQIVNTLNFTKNKFLANSAKKLANQLSNEFLIK